METEDHQIVRHLGAGHFKPRPDVDDADSPERPLKHILDFFASSCAATIKPFPNRHREFPSWPLMFW